MSAQRPRIMCDAYIYLHQESLVEQGMAGDV